jgi:hypothetical protein
MTERKNWGQTVMGWFLVQDASGDGPGESGGPDQVDAPRGPTAPEPQLNVFSTPPPAPTNGSVDFDKVFEAATIDAESRQRVSRTLELLNSLPAETEAAVKKQIVMASLRAFGVPIEQIIESSAEELQALEAYIRAGAADVEQVTKEAEQRIAKYQEEITSLQTVMQQRVADQNTVVHSCNARKLDIQKVLEFFGQEAVAKVVRDSPKLHEPQPKG